MTDPACRATLDVLTALEGGPARFAGVNLQCLVVARMANLSLEHGNSDGSCVAYVHLGWFVGPRFADHQAAFRFGKLALDLVEKRGLERFRARVSQIFGYFINPWSRHLRTGLGLLRRSFTTAQEAGDLQYAAFSCDRLATCSVRPKTDSSSHEQQSLPTLPISSSDSSRSSGLCVALPRACPLST